MQSVTQHHLHQASLQSLTPNNTRREICRCCTGCLRVRWILSRSTGHESLCRGSLQPIHMTGVHRRWADQMQPLQLWVKWVNAKMQNHVVVFPAIVRNAGAEKAECCQTLTSWRRSPDSVSGLVCETFSARQRQWARQLWSRRLWQTWRVFVLIGWHLCSRRLSGWTNNLEIRHWFMLHFCDRSLWKRFGLFRYSSKCESSLTAFSGNSLCSHDN